MFQLFGIKILAGTVIIYLVVHIIDKVNPRNRITTAFLASSVLTFLGDTPFFFVVGIFLLIYALINWYGIPLLKSLFSALICCVLFLALNFVITGDVMGSGVAYSRADIDSAISETRDKAQARIESLNKLDEHRVIKKKTRSAYDYMSFAPVEAKKRIGLMEGIENRVKENFKKLLKIGQSGCASSGKSLQDKEFRITLVNGRTVVGKILMKGEKAYIVDIADGKAEITIRKDLIASVKEL